MRRRFFPAIAVAAILVLVIGSVASAGVVSTVATDDVIVTVAPPPLALAFRTELTPSAYVGEAFPVDLQVTKSDTFELGAYTGAFIVAEVKENGVPVGSGAFEFDTYLTWSYDTTLERYWAPVALASLDSLPSVDIDFDMTATAAGTFTVSFWIETP